MKLKNIRDEIDRIDGKVFSLLKERLRLVIATLDIREDLEDISREEQILRSIDEISDDDNEKKYLTDTYSSVFKSGKQIKNRIKNKIS